MPSFANMHMYSSCTLLPHLEGDDSDPPPMKPDRSYFPTSSSDLTADVVLRADDLFSFRLCGHLPFSCFLCFFYELRLCQNKTAKDGKLLERLMILYLPFIYFHFWLIFYCHLRFCYCVVIAGADMTVSWNMASLLVTLLLAFLMCWSETPSRQSTVLTSELFEQTNPNERDAER